jgi:N-acetyl-anhydromuramoyl-L-alanine amidase
MPRVPEPTGPRLCVGPDGWLAGVRHHPSPNFGRRPTGAVVDLVVVHSISLPPGVFGSGDIDRLFTNTLNWDGHPYYQTIRGLEVSAHFVIDRQGQVTQYVGLFDRAWHAGVSFWRGRPNCNDDSVGIELEGLEGGTFEHAQYDALAALCHAIAQACPIAHVAGHEHIAPGRKLDPGPGFEWPRLVALLGWQGVQYPPKNTQQV